MQNSASSPATRAASSTSTWLRTVCAVTASEDGTAKVWRLADGRLEGEVAQSQAKDEVLRVAWAPPIVRYAAGASLLAVAGADGFCNLWRGDDWSAPKSIQRLDHEGDQVYGCAWSSCGDAAYGLWLLTAAGAAVRTWDVNAGKTIKQWSYQEPRGDQAYVFDVHRRRATRGRRPAGDHRVRRVRRHRARARRAPRLRRAGPAGARRFEGRAPHAIVGWLGDRSAPSRHTCYSGDGCCRVWDART